MDLMNVGSTSCEVSYPLMITEGISSVAEIDALVNMEVESIGETLDSVYTTDTPINGPNSSVLDFDEKYCLKKLKYPDCAEAAIKAIADLACSDDVRGGQKIEIQTSLIDKYIFGKIDELNKKGIPRVHSEFQLINILTEFICNSRQTPAVRNAIILSLFPCANPRYDYLGNLICYSICLPHTEILEAAGIWMQQVGSTSECSQKLAMHIVDYFCQIVPSSMADLIGMAELAPYFNANLLTAIAEVFREKDPSDQMLHLVDAWININPNILVACLTYFPALPPGGIPMSPITPILGLFRWCILCPTRQESFYYDQSNVVFSKRFMLYSEIFNKLCAAVYNLKNSQSNKNAISAYDLEQVMYTLIQCLQSNLPNISKASYDIAMERLSEVFRITSMANCIYGNIQKLCSLMTDLKEIHLNYMQS